MIGSAGGLLSFLGSIAADAMRSESNWNYKQKEMALQQEYNERNMALQYAYSMRAFNEQNAYNDPSAAVSRWRQAGISPAAVYSGSPGGAGVAGSLQMPNSDNPKAGGNVGPSESSAPVLLSAMRLQNESELMASQVELNKAKAAQLRGDTRSPGETLISQRLNNELLRLDVINKGIKNRQDELDFERSEVLFDTDVAISKAKLENIRTQNNLLNQQIAESVSRQLYNDAAVRESASRIVLNMAETALAQTRAQWEGKVSEAQIKKLGAEVDNLMSNVDLNNAKKFLTSCQSLSEVEKYQGLVYDNWQKALNKNLEGFKYGVDGDNSDASLTGHVLYFFEGLANMFHFGANISKTSK